MLKTVLIVIVLLFLLAGCASTELVPVGTSCPPPKPVPEVLTQLPSTAPPLVERYKSSLMQLLDSLSKAVKQ